MREKSRYGRFPPRKLKPQVLPSSGRVSAASPGTSPFQFPFGDRCDSEEADPTFSTGAVQDIE